MAHVNLWAYNSTDFGSANAPFCSDGTATSGLLPHQIRWDATIGFTDLSNLIERVGARVPASSGADIVDTLGILAHGRPNGIALLNGGSVLDSTGYGTYGPRMTELGNILHRNGPRGHRPLVILYACATASRHRDLPASVDGLLAWMSGWMENTRVVGFTRLLTLDGLRVIDLDAGAICLAPDVYETGEEYSYSRDIRDQGMNDGAGPRLDLAGPGSSSAVEYLNGNRVTAGRAPAATERRRRGGRAARPD